MKKGLFRLGLGGTVSSDGTRPLIGLDEITALQDRLVLADRRLRKGAEEAQAGHGWMCLPYREIDKVRTIAETIRESDAIVQIGIGGSALGNLMLNNAFLHPYHNELSRKERKGPRFYIADNPDPTSLLGIWDCIDPERTSFIVASKSGSTAETLAIFLWFMESLSERVGEDRALKRFVFITDPEKGLLRELATKRGIASLEVPPSVGGRFSVFSPVGLLSALALGLPVNEMLEGARMLDRQLAQKSSVRGNAAWMLAALHFLHFLKGRAMAVTMPYCDGLERFAEWHAQLWGESLGKAGKGSTPVRALGAIDQHSQVQLYVEGPDDKLFTLIDVKEKGPGFEIPGSGIEELTTSGYLAGHTFSEMLSFEAQSTAAALMKAKRPVIWLELPCLDGKRLGALVFLYEMVTALTGLLFEVDPFDQPGVEQGKRYTYGLMGKAGFEKDAEEATSGFGKVFSESLSS
jgi:glucose-6-phosphate isomerase